MGGSFLISSSGTVAYFVASGQKLDPMSERNMFLLLWCDMNLIKADTMLAELGSSNISSSKNCVAGFNINRTHTLVVQVLVSHKIKKGPVISTIIDDVLNGISLTTENWKDPPSPLVKTFYISHPVLQPFEGMSWGISY